MNVRQLAARVEPGMTPRGSPVAPAAPPGEAGTSRFAEALRRAREQAAPQSADPGFKLSAHAQQRMEQRGIPMDPAQQQSLTQALHELDAKGAQDALLLRPDAAFVVNVPSRTVVTAVSHLEMRERVFTKIDSAMLLQ